MTRTTESRGEPLALQYARKSMKIYYTISTNFWGKTPIEWNKNTLLLECKLTTKFPPSVTQWVLLQLFCIVLYGTCGGTWYVFWSPAPIGQRIVLSAVASSCITMTGVAFYIFGMAKEIESGYNELLEFQSYMVRLYVNHWNQIEKKARDSIKLAALGVYFGVLVWAYCASLTFILIPLNMDLGYEVLGNVALKYETLYGIRYWPALIVLRCVTCFSYLICIGRITSFILLYTFIVLQAYICVLAIIAKVDDQTDVARHYQKVLVLHAYMTPFINKVNGMFMFFGHTASIAMLWVGMRGYGKYPVIFLIYMLAVGSSIVYWIFFQLVALSNVRIRSASIRTHLSN